MPRSSGDSFLSDFLTKILHAFLISHAYNMHHLDLDHSNHIGERVKIINFLIMTFSLASCHSSKLEGSPCKLVLLLSLGKIKKPVGSMKWS